MSNLKEVLLLYPFPHWSLVVGENRDHYAAISYDGVNTIVAKDGTEEVREVKDNGN